MTRVRTTTLVFLGLVYLLRAEPALRSAADEQEHVQHQPTTGGALHPGDKPLGVDITATVGSVIKPQQLMRSATSGSSLTFGKTQFAEEGGSDNVTALVGQSALLLCRVRNLNNRTVSWIRKRDLHILTSMAITYTSDARFTVISNADNGDWDLRISPIVPRDEGIYECQVNTEPKIHRAVYLRVLDVQAEILGSNEVFVRQGSTISLTCIVNSQGVPPSNVSWYHAGSIIDFDGPRGGVSLETEKTKGGTTSKLLITRAEVRDSGNYSCVSSKATRATVVVHVLNGEHPAAMQHGSASRHQLLVLHLLLGCWLAPLAIVPGGLPQLLR